MKPFKKIQIFILQTQQIREGLAEQLQRWITKVEHEAEAAEDPKVRAEWTRLLGFLSQTLNSVMKAYDQVRLDEDIQRAGEILDEIKKLQEQIEEQEEELERKERQLRMKEEELRRKEQALMLKEQLGH